jgi:hypothetical protein
MTEFQSKENELHDFIQHVDNNPIFHIIVISKDKSSTEKKLPKIPISGEKNETVLDLVD